MHDLPGKFCDFELTQQKEKHFEIDIENEFVHSSMVDESYQLIGSHLDEITQQKIVSGEYVDFARLIPKDNVLTVEDNRYEMIM